MSRNELWSSSPLHSKDFQLVAGTGTLTLDLSNYYLGVSKIVSLQLITPTGVGAGTARVSVITDSVGAPVGAHATAVTVSSTVDTDASLYRLFWVNEFAFGPNTPPSYTP